MNITPIFPPTTTAIPITMDDPVVILTEGPRHTLNVFVKTHREICVEIGCESAEFDPSQSDWHCLAYCDCLIEDHAYLHWEYFITREEIISWFKMYSESKSRKDKRKAEILRPFLDVLPYFFVVTPTDRKIQRLISKQCMKYEYRPESYSSTSENPSYILDSLKHQGFHKFNTQIVNQCNISWGPTYPVNLLYNRFPNGKTRFALFFDDEDVLIDLNESEARLLDRFFNNASDNVLDCLENDKVQEILRAAVCKATKQSHQKDMWESVDAAF